MPKPAKLRTQLNIDVPENLLRDIKLIALAKKCSLKIICIEMAQDYVKRNKGAAITALKR